MRSRCPTCSTTGHPIGRMTLEALVLPERLPADRQDWAFCQAADCPVVYFSAAGQTLGQEHIKVRVGVKVSSPPHTVCYCFAHTRESIREELERTGRSTAFDAVKAEIEAGRCACELKNPRGSCCLADVRRAVEAARESSGTEDCPQGVKDCEVVQDAKNNSGSRTLLVAVGSLCAATVASACCWLPLLLVALGLSSAGVSAAFASLRPWFLGIASTLLALAFCSVFLRRQSCASAEACATRSRASRSRQGLLLLVATAVVLVVALFPNWALAVLDREETRPMAAGLDLVRLSIDGMHCEACSVAIRKELAKVAGVSRAQVDYVSKTATVWFEPLARPGDADLLQAVVRAGYAAHLQR